MEEIGFLNSDVPINVLSRLPTKTLFGLKCVSRGWYRLISDRTFINTQVQLQQRHEPISGFLFQERFRWCDADIHTNTFIPIGEEGNTKVNHRVFDFLPEHIVILASSHGLVCCRSCFPSQDPLSYVCNPSNKDWISFKWNSKIEKGDSVALAFDPLQNPIDTSTDFKVIRVRSNETELENYYFSFEIYSSKTKVWRTSKEVCDCNHNLMNNNGISIGGMLHWLTDADHILTFDVENELSWLVVVPFPATKFFNSVPVMCIGESENRLHYVVVSEYGLQIWVLEDLFESVWALKYSVELETLELENSQSFLNLKQRVAHRIEFDMDPYMDPLAFKDGILLMRVSNKIYLYHVESRKVEDLCSLLDLGPNSLVSPVVLPYSMSLVPLS